MYKKSLPNSLFSFPLLFTSDINSSGQLRSLFRATQGQITRKFVLDITTTNVIPDYVQRTGTTVHLLSMRTL